jgi:drug/metabolite transporter (DMT)-like permease
LIDRRVALWLTLPPLFWAGNAVVARALVGQFPPLALSLLRWVLALAILLPFAWRALAVHRGALLAQWKTVVVLGVVGIGGYNTFQYLAVQTSTALNVTLIAAANPIFILAVGAALFGERTRGMQWLGAAVSLCGVLVVLTRGVPENLARFSFVRGDLIMLAANLSWTIYTWVLRKHRPDVPFVPLLAAQMAVGIVVIAPLAAFEVAGGASIHWNFAAALALLYIALFPSLVSYACWDHGVKRVGAVVPVYFANLTPLFAAALSTVLLGEAPRVYHVIALALIVGGIHLAARGAAARPDGSRA